MYAPVPQPCVSSPITATRPARQPFLRAKAVSEPEGRYGEAEREPPYEPLGSELRTLGSISVAHDAHWTATLTVPIPERNVAFVELERRGELPAGYHGSGETAHLSLPVTELDAVVTLLAGIIHQARNDHVLPPRWDARGE